MVKHAQHKTYNGQAVIVTAIFVALLLYIFWAGNPAVINIARDTFDLTVADLKMIPVSGLAFLIFCILMQKLFFAPILTLIETREAMTDGAQTSAQELIKSTEDLKKAAEQKLFDARLSGAQAKMTTLSRARAEAQTITDRVQSEVARKLKVGRKEIADRSATLQKDLMSQLDEIAGNAVKKILEVPENQVGGRH